MGVSGLGGLLGGSVFGLIVGGEIVYVGGRLVSVFEVSKIVVMVVVFV